jgi:phosphoribosyl-AMP cyclohydrolase
MKIVKINDLDFEKGDGLIPVVVQEFQTKEVLTLAYVNQEALQVTIDTGLAHYYRRSHGKVMMKGITSGNTQKVKSILTDCDLDSIIYLVHQKGPACHLGKRTCFHVEVDATQ